jgi:hypothetical protein
MLGLNRAAKSGRRFEQRHACVWIKLDETMRGCQSGDSATDDDDVRHKTMEQDLQD